MAQLTERDFLDIKDEIKDGRLSPDSIRFYLGVFMFFSGLMVGTAYAVTSTSDSLIGWENLSTFWQIVFKFQAVLFIFQLILILLVRGKNNWSQILLNISYVFYTYKMVIDPFIMTLMFAKNDGVYEEYLHLALGIIIFGFLVHLYFIRRKFTSLIEEKEKNKNKKKKKSDKLLYALFPILLFLVSVTGYIIKNDLLGDYDILFLLGVGFFLLVAVMIGAVEFVLGAYCVVRFPSFRVNPPPRKIPPPRKKVRTKRNRR